MSKKKNKLEIRNDLSSSLKSSYIRHRDSYINGCSDPVWEDGFNINLVRNHIIYGKSLCEDNFGEEYLLYPDEYFFPTPKEISNLYMAKQRTCRGTVIRGNRDHEPYSEILKFDWSEVFNE